MSELVQFISTMQKLDRTYSGLPHKIASEAVNFFKQRFRDQAWADTRQEPWKPRKSRGTRRDKKRAILVDKGKLKRDIQKIHVSGTRIIIGTTKLTAPYAKVHNEGFRGTVNIPQHNRRKFATRKESYNTKRGTIRTRSVKAVDKNATPGIVKTHKRRMNIPRRQFMGPSVILDKRIQRLITAEFLRALK